MKRCPTCGLSLDESQTYCTNDGTPLVADKPYDPQATVMMPPGGAQTSQPSGGQSPASQTGWQTPARPTTPPLYAQQNFNQPAGNQPGKFIPALIGGAVTGVLSLIAGFMSPDVFVIFSFFCIVWALIGGALAAKLFINRSPNPVRSGEGAVVGLISGAIAAAIYLAIATPIAYSIHGDYIEFVASQQPERISAGAFFALTGIAGAVTIFGVSIVGGLIGVAMFEKRKAYHASIPPPPPPGYGAPPGF